MSVDLVVFTARRAMPAPRVWARSIVEAGFPAELDSDFDIDDFSGFLPCRYDGIDAGFEYLAGPPEAVELELGPEIDFSVTFVTHSDARELASSIAAAATLCSLTGGLLYDPQAGASVTAQDVMHWARETLAELQL